MKNPITAISVVCLCAYYIKVYTFLYDFFVQIMCGSVFRGRRPLIPSLSEWNRLNISPDDTVRMYYWLYETKFLAEDIGPARSGQIHFITSMIKPDGRTGHTFDELIPLKRFLIKESVIKLKLSRATCSARPLLFSCLCPSSPPSLSLK